MVNKRFLVDTAMIIVCAAGFALVASGCSSNSNSSQNLSSNAAQNSAKSYSEPDYKGVVKSKSRGQMNQNSPEFTEVLVENAQPVKAKEKFDKVFVWVTNETQIYMQSGENRLPTALDALTEGSEIEFRTTGAVMTSSPAKVVATEVVIVKK